MLDCLPLVIKYACQAIGDCGVVPAWTVSHLACSILGAAPGAAFTASAGGSPQAEAFGSNLFALLGAFANSGLISLIQALIAPFTQRLLDGYRWIELYINPTIVSSVMHENLSQAATSHLNGNAVLIASAHPDEQSPEWLLSPEQMRGDFLCALYEGDLETTSTIHLGWCPSVSIATTFQFHHMVRLYGTGNAQHSALLTRTIPVLLPASTVYAEPATPNEALLRPYHELIQALFACRHRQCGVVMESDAAGLLRNYANDCIRKAGDGENYAFLRFAQHAARLSLIFHLAKHGPSAASHMLSAETIEAAIRYMQYLGVHVLAVYRYAAACETAKNDQAIVAVLSTCGAKGATARLIARKAADPDSRWVFQRRFRSETAALAALVSAVQRNVIVSGTDKRFRL
jgi:hypothetical protein